MKLFRRDNSSSDCVEKRLLILGLENAGKTSVLNVLTKKECIGTIPTIGLNVESLEYKKVKISLWDLGGAATLLWKHYYQDIDGIIFVVDCADAQKVDEAKMELYKVAKDHNLTEVPILILGNKQDLRGAISDEELSNIVMIDEIQKKHKIVCGCSAKEKRGVFEGFEKVLEIAMRNTPKQ